MVEPSTLEDKLRQAFPDAEKIEIEDLTGTKDHYRATIVAEAFEDKTRVEQHQLVYAALGDLMSGPVHALALQTYSPQAWKKQNG